MKIINIILSLTLISCAAAVEPTQKPECAELTTPANNRIGCLLVQTAWLYSNLYCRSFLIMSKVFSAYLRCIADEFPNPVKNQLLALFNGGIDGANAIASACPTINHWKLYIDRYCPTVVLKFNDYVTKAFDSLSTF